MRLVVHLKDKREPVYGTQYPDSDAVKFSELLDLVNDFLAIAPGTGRRLTISNGASRIVFPFSSISYIEIERIEEE